ncbi:cytosolic thiouridylase subunit 2 [Xylocopa sonorina]|uniref:cytosolic thiouridylase subunit 2 n=1 Tax=Xylocopa sonorina TaxID=1818115 RepID=UPI00403AAE8F
MSGSCDGFETEEITENIITPPTADAMNVCKRCGSEVEVCLINKNAYCKTCFLTALRHKFRATLGKSKLLRPNDSILIGHSGKANSTVLLHLITADVNEPISKRFKFQSKVLYIDDGMVKGLTVEERECIKSALIKEAESLPLTVYTVPLLNYTNHINCKEIHPTNIVQMSTTNEDTTLKKVFENLENDTARDELLKQLKRKLLISMARKLNCNKIFMADTSLDLAIKVLGDVSTGRGSQLSFNVAFSDGRYKDVMLLRPLREFTQDDVARYLDYYKLCPIFNSQKYNAPFSASIRNVAKSFVSKLDSEFYSTVSTIYRTSEKLATKCEKSSGANINPNTLNICILCEVPLNSCYPPEEQLSVVQAKRLSKFASLGSIDDLKKEKCQCHSSDCNSSECESLAEKYLCYSCHLIFLNSKKVDTILPNFISSEIREKFELAKLQNEIADFLL